MLRIVALLTTGAAGVLLTPAPAPAQFQLGGPYVPNIVPSHNPFFYIPQYRYYNSRSYGFSGPYGNFQYNSYRWGVSVNNPAAVVAAQSLYSNPLYAVGRSTMTSGTPAMNQLALQAQRNLERAQREAALPTSRTGDTTNPDRGPVGGIPVPGPVPALPPELAAAIAATDPVLIAAGDPLNAILKEVQRVEGTGAKGPSAFVSPLLMDDLRFAGSSAADLLNLARQTLEFPAIFDDAALAAVRKDLAKDYAPISDALQAGKAPDPAKVAVFAATVKRAQGAAAPLVKDLPADGPARTFLKQLDSVTTALRAGAGAGLIDPKWASEGLTVADLVKHMTKHKLAFAPAPLGRDDSYTALHKNLATYLFVLTQAKK